MIFVNNTLPAGETLLDLLRSFELLAGDIALGSFELIFLCRSVGVPGTGVVQVLETLSRVNLEALEKTPCNGSHFNRW